jgi:hypothetical protein
MLKTAYAAAAAVVGRITTTGGMEIVDTVEEGGFAMLKTA